ncbi:MAG TPA: hypothetical protein VHR72_03160 [Gemmataceae bacterium]|jgi:hypothetical protein|nr:hypothetical protein [Gemmataceae bacterium]
MSRAFSLAMAFCLALLLSSSTARAARIQPDRFGPLTPQQKRELEQHTFNARLMLAGFGGVVVLAAIGQLVFSIRNFQRASEDEKKAREEEPADNLERALGIPIDAAVDEPLDEAEPVDEFAEPIDLGEPLMPRHDDPCGIVANHVGRLDR